MTTLDPTPAPTLATVTGRDGDWPTWATRWTQLTFTEDDPLHFDPEFWLDVMRRSRSNATCLSAGGYMAFYPTQVLPGQLVFGLGLAITVAPLTAAILGAVPAHDAGIGSAVNNAVARVAGLVTVAFAGIITGGVLDVASFHRALLVTAALLLVGGLLSLVGIRNVRGVDPDQALVKPT